MDDLIKEFDLLLNKYGIMVNAMRTKYHQVNSRTELTDSIFYLYKGLKSIEKKDLADELATLYAEIDAIDTSQIIKMGTFKQ